MTAVEWLWEQIPYEFTSNRSAFEVFEQAKEMEKQQIMNTYIIADSESTQEDSEHNALKFYERTYGSKESDATSSQTTSDKWKEYQDWLNEVPELSDEEIEKGAKEWYNKEGAYSASAIAIKTWVYAIRWYREQLKQINEKHK